MVISSSITVSLPVSSSSSSPLPRYRRSRCQSRNAHQHRQLFFFLRLYYHLLDHAVTFLLPPLCRRVKLQGVVLSCCLPCVAVFSFKALFFLVASPVSPCLVSRRCFFLVASPVPPCLVSRRCSVGALHLQRGPRWPATLWTPQS